jgi:hypothetical protein
MAYHPGYVEVAHRVLSAHVVPVGIRQVYPTKLASNWASPSGSELTNAISSTSRAHVRDHGIVDFVIVSVGHCDPLAAVRSTIPAAYTEGDDRVAWGAILFEAWGEETIRQREDHTYPSAGTPAVCVTGGLRGVGQWNITTSQREEADVQCPCMLLRL